MRGVRASVFVLAAACSPPIMEAGRDASVVAAAPAPAIPSIPLPAPPPVPGKIPSPQRSMFGTTAAELLELSGPELKKGLFGFGAGDGADQSSTPDLWRLLDKIDRERDAFEHTWEPDFHYGRVVGVIADRATLPDFERLLDTYDGLPPDSRRRHGMAEALLDFRIRQHVAALVKKPAPRLSGRAAPSLPPALAQAPEELQRAWTAYKEGPGGATTDLRSAGGPVGGGIAVQQSWPVFHQAISALLHETGDDHIASMNRFYWGGHCGTGAEQLREPQTRALFLAALLRGRHLEAAGLLSRSPGSFNSPRHLSRHSSWPADYLAWLQFDALAMHAGAAADGQFAAHASFLVEDGSERAARFLLALSEAPVGSYGKASYLRNLAAFIDPGPRAYNMWRKRKDAAIPAALQRAALAHIMKAVRPDADPEILEAAVHVLSELRRPETRSTLRELARLPLERAKRQAIEALRRMGEDIPALPAAQPVVFKLVSPGRSLDGQTIWWHVKYPQGREMSSSAVVKGGQIPIDRDHFSGRGATEVVLERRRKLALPKEPQEGPDIPWLKVSLPPPADLSAATKVEVRMGGLSVRVPTSAPAGTRMKVTLVHSGELWKTEGFIFDYVGEFDLPSSSVVSFPNLQEGKYDITARWHDGTEWVVRKVEVGAGTTEAVAAPSRAPSSRPAPVESVSE